MKRIDSTDAPADRAMTRYGAGDAAAFSELYDLLAPCIERRLARHVRDRQLVEDLVQETFLKIHRNRGRFIPGAPVKPWACSIAIRLLIDFMRRNRNWHERFVIEEGEETEALGEFDPEQHLVASELAAQLTAILATLPAAQRRAWNRVKVDGASIHDVADQEGTTENAIKLRVFKSVERIRAALLPGRR